jgi:hypothetical protein
MKPIHIRQFWDSSLSPLYHPLRIFFRHRGLALPSSQLCRLADRGATGHGEAIFVATTAQRRLAAAEDDDVLTTLRLAHNEIIHLTDLERAQFIAAVAPGVEEQRQRFAIDSSAFLNPNTAIPREGV